jgi:hypothetical protein
MSSRRVRNVWLRLFALGVLGLLAASAGVAQGELTRSGNLVVSLQGGLTPRALPRDRLAPVEAHVKGSVRTTDGSRPPVLRQMSVAINSHGRIFSRGLPTCTTGKLQQTSSKRAIARCKGAVVGRGSFDANVAFPNLAPFPAHGRLLVFNGRDHGRQALIFHIYGTSPIQIAFVLPLIVTHRRDGRFGTLLIAQFPRLASDLGYVTGVDFTIGRRYRYKGRMRSFLSASCAAPKGLTGAVYSFARGTFGFSNGKSVQTSLIRDCRVR